MTKLCPRGKAAAKRKFKVYPSAYANAYASKICAGKIKDPSGTKRKDWGPKKMTKGGGADFDTSGSRIKPYGKTAKVKIEKLKPKASYNKPFYRREAKVGMAVTAGAQSGMGRLEKSGMTKAKKGKMMIMIAIGKPKKANKGLHAETKKKKKAIPGDPDERRDYLRNIQNPKSEYDKKGKLKYTFANKGKIMQVANKLEKASKAHAGQAKTLRSIKVRGGGMAIQGMNFKGVY